MNLDDRCQSIEFILSDVDGVLTDGGIIFDNRGIETKRFQTRDGMGIKLWRKAGFRFGLLTARSSHIVKLRASELGVDVLRQGVEDKLPAARQLFEELGIDPTAVCYIGDDFPDLPVIRFVGLGVAVADAAAEVTAGADHTTTARGGRGAVRETVEFILKAQGRWDDLVRIYVGD